MTLMPNCKSSIDAGSAVHTQIRHPQPACGVAGGERSRRPLLSAETERGGHAHTCGHPPAGPVTLWLACRQQNS